MPNVTITALPAALTLTGSELLPLDQAGSTRHVSVSALLSNGGAVSEAVLVAATALSGHRTVVLTALGVVYADRTDLTLARLALGVTTGAAVAGGSVVVRFGGLMDEPSWTWIPDAPVYLSTTGFLTQIPPIAGVLRRIAWAVTSTRIFIAPSEPITL